MKSRKKPTLQDHLETIGLMKTSIHMMLNGNMGLLKRVEEQNKELNAFDAEMELAIECLKEATEKMDKLERANNKTKNKKRSGK